MIEPGHPRLSIVRQCELASISRSSFYREPTAENEETLRLMRLIDEQFLEMPWYGSRQMMDADFCVAALEEAIGRFGRPEFFNTDQGSQFTSFALTNTLKDADMRISMDGRGRWMDNVFIERLWRSRKYECVFLNAFGTGSEARTGIGCWINYYNADRPHAAFGGRTPHEVYATQANEEKLAA